jgi:hypothetical protein
MFVLSCTKDDGLNIIDLEKPVAMNVFCQSSSNTVLSRIEYEYCNDHLTLETTLYNGEIQNKTTYEYNSNNQLIFEADTAYQRKTEKTFFYNERNQLINIKYKFIDYNSIGEVINVNDYEAPREYKNNWLAKEWEYWGGFNTYDYKNDKVITKVDYTKMGQKHHITTYKYSGDLLIEEKKETIAGGLIYLKYFKYDSKNRLTKIQDGENTIEEYDYIDKRLIEKRTYYFGIDPGFFSCNGNYIYKYEY